MSDTPPFHIESGKFSSKGICDGLISEIEYHNPDVHFDTLIAPEVRISKMLDDGAPVCFPCMIYREKATSRSQYSIPTTLYPPYVLIIKKSDKTKFESFGSPVKLEQLLQDRKLRLGREVARKYGDLQEMIQTSPAYQNSIASHNSIRSSEAIAELVTKGRVDYAIDYLTTYRYLTLTGHESLAMLPIEEAGDFVTGAIGCSASNPEFSKKALKIINETLKESVLASPAYKEHLSFWMDSFPDYWKYFEKEVLKK